MKNLENLKRKLNKIGYEVEFDKYEYWQNVIYAVNKENGKRTPLVFDIYCRNGALGLTDCLDDNTPFSIIEKSLKSNCERLGYYDYTNNRISKANKYLSIDYDC